MRTTAVNALPHSCKHSTPGKRSNSEILSLKSQRRSRPGASTSAANCTGHSKADVPNALFLTAADSSEIWPPINPSSEISASPNPTSLPGAAGRESLAQSPKQPQTLLEVLLVPQQQMSHTTPPQLVLHPDNLSMLPVTTQGEQDNDDAGKLMAPVSQLVSVPGPSLPTFRPQAVPQSDASAVTARLASFFESQTHPQSCSISGKPAGLQTQAAAMTPSVRPLNPCAAVPRSLPAASTTPEPPAAANETALSASLPVAPAHVFRTDTHDTTHKGMRVSLAEVTPEVILQPASPTVWPDTEIPPLQADVCPTVPSKKSESLLSSPPTKLVSLLCSITVGGSGVSKSSQTHEGMPLALTKAGRQRLNTIMSGKWGRDATLGTSEQCTNGGQAPAVGHSPVPIGCIASKQARTPPTLRALDIGNRGVGEQADASGSPDKAADGTSGGFNSPTVSQPCWSTAQLRQVTTPRKWGLSGDVRGQEQTSQVQATARRIRNVIECAHVEMPKPPLQIYQGAAERRWLVAASLGKANDTVARLFEEYLRREKKAERLTLRPGLLHT